MKVLTAEFPPFSSSSLIQESHRRGIEDRILHRKLILSYFVSDHHLNDTNQAETGERKTFPTVFIIVNVCRF